MTTVALRRILQAAAIQQRPSLAREIRAVAESYDESSFRELARAARAFVASLIEEAEELAAERRREAEEAAVLDAAAEELARARAIIESIVAAIDAAVRRPLDWYRASTGSMYAEYRTIVLRVSDHAQPEDGAWSYEDQSHRPRADVEFLAEAGVPTREAIRESAARVLRARRHH